MAEMKFIPFEEVEDKLIGKIGTPRRDAYEARLEEEMKAYRVGEAIKKARQSKNLSQEQLGELMGVKKAQISKIESGRNITFATLTRAFKAMGIAATLNFGGMQISLT